MATRLIYCYKRQRKIWENA